MRLPSAEPAPVRLPFRVLAALGFLVVLGAGTAGIVLVLGQSGNQYWRDVLIAAPAFLWLGRLFLAAAVDGSAGSAGDSWPFASHRLFCAYLAALALLGLTS